MTTPGPIAPAAGTATAPATAAPPPSWWGSNYSINFSAKTTFIYIGASLGVLGIIMCFLMLTMILWVRPNRRRRLQALARERHRLETLQEVKVEPDNFKAQVRAFPVVVVQPDSSELACGRKISLDRSSDSFQTQDIETGHANPSSSSLEDVKEDPSHSSREERSVQFEETVEKGEGEVTYNPLTHYLTERQPHLFVAEISR